MYRTGHLGISLLMFSPIGYLLVSVGSPFAALLTGASMIWLAMLPDVDHRLEFLEHRGVTHSLLFAVFVGAAFWVGGHLVMVVGGGTLGAELRNLGPVQGVVLPTVGFAVGFLSVCAHLLGDLLTPAGVNVFWPVGSEYSLSITPADSTFANNGLLLLGTFTVGAAATVALDSIPV